MIRASKDVLGSSIYPYPYPYPSYTVMQPCKLISDFTQNFVFSTGKSKKISEFTNFEFFGLLLPILCPILDIFLHKKIYIWQVCPISLVPREIILSLYLHPLFFRTKRLKGGPGTSNTSQITAAVEGMEKGDEDEEEEEGGKGDKKWRKEETIKFMDFE